MSRRRILLAGGGTGGHLMPALALADALVSLDATIEPVLVGAQRGIEARILPQRPFRYHLLPVEPLYRRAWWRNGRWPLVLWRVWRGVERVLAEERPVLVVGTGGYAAGPTLWLAARRGMALALQEQNAVPGITTRWLAPRARQIHLGFPEAAAYLRPGAETAVYALGNPIQPPPEPRLDPLDARARLGAPRERPVVLVMGGSQGARAINEAVAGIVKANGLGDVTLLWSTGPSEFDAYRAFHHPPARHVRGFWDPIAEAYAAADLVIARSGAMTTAELCAWGLPAVLIPLPSAAARHQTRNAEALAAAGAAVHLPEAQLSASVLSDRVADLLETPPKLARMRRAARQRGRPDAARRIAETLMALVS